MSGAIHADKQPRREVKIVEMAPPTARTSAQLTVGPVSDPAEVEAERVAEEVLARLRPDQQAERSDAQQLPAAAGDSTVGPEGGPVPSVVAQLIEDERGRGQLLSPDVHTRMEAAFDADLSQVRVHTGPEAAALSSSISARAFTTGSDIFFGAGEYAPDTPRGERTLAHELAHTRQQTGVQRVQRFWDVKAKSLPWAKARKERTRTLDDRDGVFFVQDNSGDEIVVKVESQPIGLGNIVGKLQKKITDIKSVEQRKLGKDDRDWIEILVQSAAMLEEPSWVARGKKLNAKQPDAAMVTDLDFAGLAEGRAVEELRKPGNLMAMTLAEGKKASQWATEQHGATPGESKLRAVLDAPGHFRVLGRMTAVDLFAGNQDRAASGNLGNWFYSAKEPNLTNAMTLIDQVEPFSQVQDFKTGKWIHEKEMQSGNLSGTAQDIVGVIKGGMIKAGDAGATAWLAADVDGTTRRDRFAAEMEAGLREARQKIIDIFSATRRDFLSSAGRSNRAAKKQIKEVATAATRLDEGDARFGGGKAPDYYAELKRRAMYMKTH
jgi:Domain of unknown function (DUF4157)